MANTGVEFLKCKCVAETKDAICVKGIEEQDIWVPKSQVHDDSEVYRNGTDGTLVVTEWWATQRGLV